MPHLKRAAHQVPRIKCRNEYRSKRNGQDHPHPRDVTSAQDLWQVPLILIRFGYLIGEAKLLGVKSGPHLHAHCNPLSARHSLEDPDRVWRPAKRNPNGMRISGRGGERPDVNSKAVRYNTGIPTTSPSPTTNGPRCAEPQKNLLEFPISTAWAQLREMKNLKMTPTRFERITFRSGVERATVAP